MAEDKLALLEVWRKAEEHRGDARPAAVRWLVQELMAAEVSAQIGAVRSSLRSERPAPRNGHRRRLWDTRLGTLELSIPRLRTAGDFPSWLEPRRGAEQALVAVIAAAYVQGVLPHEVQALVQARWASPAAATARAAGAAAP